MAIQEIGERLLVGQAYPTHAPASLFAAAMVYCAMTLAELQEVRVPREVAWGEVWDEVRGGLAVVNASGVVSGGGDPTTATTSACRVFVQEGQCPPSSNVPVHSKNLSFSLHTLQAILRAVSCQWGVCHEMLGMIESWLSSPSRQMKG